MLIFACLKGIFFFLKNSVLKNQAYCKPDFAMLVFCLVSLPLKTVEKCSRKITQGKNLNWNGKEFIESQNILSWEGPTRIIQSNSCPCL